MAASTTTFLSKHLVSNALIVSSTARSSPTSLSFPFSAKHFVEQLALIRAIKPTTKTRCSIKYREAVAAADAAHEKAVAYPRPSEIQWKKELCNSVQLIGTVGTDVQVNQFTSGKVLAWTRIAVKKINLTFWDELAHTAYQHVQKGEQIYVSGRLISDTVTSNDGKQQTYYKKLNFVERNFSPPVTLYDDSSSSKAASGGKFNSSTENKLPAEALWQAFFVNPTDWWDNRKNKKNPKYPDFKHKDTGEALWIESRYNPPWVKSQLEILDSRMEASRVDPDALCACDTEHQFKSLKNNGREQYSSLLHQTCSRFATKTTTMETKIEAF
ncbi:hypothetical protein V2J09_003293 [Rumex salicifolius]